MVEGLLAVSVRQILATEKKESHAMQRIAAPPQLIRRNRWAYYGAGLLRVGRTEGDGTVYIYAGCGRRCSRGRFDSGRGRQPLRHDLCYEHRREWHGL